MVCENEHHWGMENFGFEFNHQENASSHPLYKGTTKSISKASNERISYIGLSVIGICTVNPASLNKRITFDLCNNLCFCKPHDWCDVVYPYSMVVKLICRFHCFPRFQWNQAVSTSLHTSQCEHRSRVYGNALISIQRPHYNSQRSPHLHLGATTLLCQSLICQLLEQAQFS
jgi:hypothetical protein